jgi:ABC-type polysaccharide/polyol phosphate export permease
LSLELVLLVLRELVLSLPAGLCELVLSLPYLVLQLFLFLCCCLCSCAVRRDLGDVFGVLADVAMVSSPRIFFSRLGKNTGR